MTDEVPLDSVSLLHSDRILPEEVPPHNTPVAEIVFHEELSLLLIRLQESLWRRGSIHEDHIDGSMLPDLVQEVLGLVALLPPACHKIADENLFGMALPEGLWNPPHKEVR